MFNTDFLSAGEWGLGVIMALLGVGVFVHGFKRQSRTEKVLGSAMIFFQVLQLSLIYQKNQNQFKADEANKKEKNLQISRIDELQKSKEINKLTMIEQQKRIEDLTLITAQRTLSEGQRKVIASELEGIPGGRFSISYSSRDPEAAMFALEVRDFLMDLGFPCEGTASEQLPKEPDPGIEVFANPKSYLPLLVGAFTNAKLKVYGSTNRTDHLIRIRVGPKE
ncbi:MAG: hypothetical protein ACO1QB_16510 [Verrucomicrobiales bacterium]